MEKNIVNATDFGKRKSRIVYIGVLPTGIAKFNSLLYNTNCKLYFYKLYTYLLSRHCNFLRAINHYFTLVNDDAIERATCEHNIFTGFVPIILYIIRLIRVVGIHVKSIISIYSIKDNIIF